MLLALDHRSRCTLACAGAILASIGLALIPVCGRSAMDAAVRPGYNDIPAETVLPPALPNLVLPRVDDPFARKLPSRANRPAPPPRNLKNHKDRGHPFLRAVVAGAHPRALVEDGSVRIVGVGDTVDGSKVIDIEPNGIVLDDGRRLGFGETTR